jgi:energy-coupling factor transporter ATP-binding protein EcfA2
MDVVAKVQESFHRTISTIASDVRSDVRAIVEDNIANLERVVEASYSQALQEFRDLMPQQHEMIIRAPDATTRTEGRPHYQLQRLVDWLNLREHVMTVGPAGSGKTTAAEQAAGILDLPAYVLPCGMATNDWSLLGFISPTGSYVPGHMRQPFEHGGVFVLDEIDNTNPSVLTTINGALSGKNYQFPDAMIQKHPDFVVVGCANTYGTGPDRLYVGRNQLDAATLDRFKKISWGIDEDAEFDWAGRDQTSWVRYVQRVRACASDLAMRVVVSPRASIGGAKGLRNGLDWQHVAEDCIWRGMSSDDSTRILEIVGAN